MKTNHTPKHSRFALPAVLLLAIAGALPLHAQLDTEKWISTTSGDWSDSANWLNGIVPPASGADIQFAGVITDANNVTSTIDSAWSANGSVNSLTFFAGSQAATATGSFIVAQGAGVSSLTLGAGGLSIAGGRSGISMTGPLLLSTSQTWNFLSEGAVSGTNTVVPRLVLSNSLNGVSAGTTLTLRGGDDLNRLPASAANQGNLHLVGTSGAMGTNIDRINLHGGTIRLGANSTESNFNRIADATAIASYGGSGLIVFRQGNGTEELGALHLEKGLFQVRGDTAGGSGTSLYRFASLANRAAGTTLFLDSGIGTANQINFQFANAGGLDTNENGIIGGWAIGQTQSAGYRFLAPAANNTTITTVAGTNIANQAALDTVAAADNINLTFQSATLAGNTTINSLRMEGALAQTQTLDLGGFTLRLGSGGFIAREGTNVTISNGNITAGQAVDTAATLYFHQSPASSAAANVNLSNAPIVDNGSGAVSVVYSGPDVDRSFTLSPNSTYTGTTYIQSTVRFNSVAGTNYFGADPGSPVADKIQISSGRIDSNAATTIAPNFGILLSGGGLEVRQTAGLLNIDSAISGDGRLMISNGHLYLRGSASNTYTGPTVVSRIATGFSESNLYLNKTGGATAIAGDIHIISRNMTDVFSNAMVRLDASNQIADTSLVTIINGSGIAETRLRLNGHSDTIRGVVGGGAGSVVEAGQFSASSLTLSPLANDRNEFTGTVRNWATGGGALSITVNGHASGTQVFSGTNTYTGTTTVSAGTLLINGTHTGAGNYTVSNTGTTLGGTGRIAPTGSAGISVGSDAIVAPGASIGTLTVDGVDSIGTELLTMNTGAVFEFELNASGGSADRIDFWNYISFGDQLVLNNNEINLSLLGTLTPGNYTVDLFRFYSNNGTTLVDSGITTGLVIGTLGSGIQSASLNYTGETIELNYSVIPEPGTSLLLLLAGVGFLALRQRKA